MNSKTPRDQRGWYPVPDGTRIAHGAQTLAHELEFIYCVQLSAFAGRKTEQRAPRKGDCRRPMSLLWHYCPDSIRFNRDHLVLLLHMSSQKRCGYRVVQGCVPRVTRLVTLASSRVSDLLKNEKTGLATHVFRGQDRVSTRRIRLIVRSLDQPQQSFSRGSHEFVTQCGSGQPIFWSRSI